MHRHLKIIFKKTIVLFSVLKQNSKGYKEPLIDSLDVPASHGGLTKTVAFGIKFCMAR